MNSFNQLTDDALLSSYCKAVAMDLEPLFLELLLEEIKCRGLEEDELCLNING